MGKKHDILKTANEIGNLRAKLAKLDKGNTEIPVIKQRIKWLESRMGNIAPAQQ